MQRLNSLKARVEKLNASDTWKQNFTEAVLKDIKDFGSITSNDFYTLAKDMGLTVAEANQIKKSNKTIESRIEK